MRHKKICVKGGPTVFRQIFVSPKSVEHNLKFSEIPNKLVKTNRNSDLMIFYVLVSSVTVFPDLKRLFVLSKSRIF